MFSEVISDSVFSTGPCLSSMTPSPSSPAIQRASWMPDLQSKEGLRASEVPVSLGTSLTSARILQSLISLEEASVLRLYPVKC